MIRDLGFEIEGDVVRQLGGRSYHCGGNERSRRAPRAYNNDEDGINRPARLAASGASSPWRSEEPASAVGVNYHKEKSKAEAVVQEIYEAGNKEAEIFECDVRDSLKVRQMMDGMVRPVGTFGRAD